MRFGDDGHGRDEPAYPATAVRELLVNALAHRDVASHALGYPTTLTVQTERLVISNPGGLWGITVDRLGREPISSARNATLLKILEKVRTSDGHRVVEGLATGIQTALKALRAAGMVEPAFVDQGVRFTVLVPHHALLADDDIHWVAEISRGLPLNDAQRHALVAMRHGRTWTNRTYREAFPRDSTVARAELQGLVDVGLVQPTGERGGRTYRLASDPHRPTAVASAAPAPPPAVEPSHESAKAVVARALFDGGLPFKEILAATGLTPARARRALDLLREEGAVVMHGAQGARATRYLLVGS